MAWDGSDRRDRLPDNWPALRAQRLRLDGYRCTWKLPSGVRCPRPATDVDHRVAGDDHRIGNLRSLCAHHHGQKSSQEGRQAQRQRANRGKRPPEEHPGALR